VFLLLNWKIGCWVRSPSIWNASVQSICQCWASTSSPWYRACILLQDCSNPSQKQCSCRRIGRLGAGCGHYRLGTPLSKASANAGHQLRLRGTGPVYSCMIAPTLLKNSGIGRLSACCGLCRVGTPPPLYLINVGCRLCVCGVLLQDSTDMVIENANCGGHVQSAALPEATVSVVSRFILTIVAICLCVLGISLCDCGKCMPPILHFAYYALTPPPPPETGAQGGVCGLWYSATENKRPGAVC
jgi:hypothetical protein